ncbi:MAG: ATP-binding protein [Nitrospirales bacterium]
MNQEFIQLSKNRAILVFQSVRELLMNVLKHAGVNKATVKQTGRRYVRLRGRQRERDRCRGHIPGSGARRLGLFAVQERMEAVDGRVKILSTPGQGTKVILVFPEDGARTVNAEVQLPDRPWGTDLKARTQIRLVAKGKVERGG